MDFTGWALLTLGAVQLLTVGFQIVQSVCLNRRLDFSRDDYRRVADALDREVAYRKNTAAALAAAAELAGHPFTRDHVSRID